MSIFSYISLTSNCTSNPSPSSSLSLVSLLSIISCITSLMKSSVICLILFFRIQRSSCLLYTLPKNSASSEVKYQKVRYSIPLAVVSIRDLQIDGFGFQAIMLVKRALWARLVLIFYQITYYRFYEGWKKMDKDIMSKRMINILFVQLRCSNAEMFCLPYEYVYNIMGKKKIANKFAAVKRIISSKDHRIKQNKAKEQEHDRKRQQAMAKQAPDDVEVKQLPKEPSCLFFTHNNALGPPYRIIIDTNFINFSIQNKLDIFKASMDCLLGKCIPYITDCVVGELEKFGVKYRMALKISKDPRFQRLKCNHKGTYADDCIVERIKQHRCFIVATCDKDLKRRIRKVPGVPIMYIMSHKYTIERMAEAYGAPK